MNVCIHLGLTFSLNTCCYWGHISASAKKVHQGQRPNYKAHYDHSESVILFFSWICWCVMQTVLPLSPFNNTFSLHQVRHYGNSHVHAVRILIEPSVCGLALTHLSVWVIACRVWKGRNLGPHYHTSRSAGVWFVDTGRVLMRGQGRSAASCSGVDIATHKHTTHTETQNCSSAKFQIKAEWCIGWPMEAGGLIYFGAEWYRERWQKGVACHTVFCVFKSTVSRHSSTVYSLQCKTCSLSLSHNNNSLHYALLVALRFFSAVFIGDRGSVDYERWNLLSLLCFYVTATCTVRKNDSLNKCP